MTAEPEIRALNDSQIDPVVQLWRDCDLVRPWNDARADIEFARRSGAAEVLVAVTAEGTIVGSAMVGNDGHRGWFYYVAVAPSLQKTGLGRRLIAAGEDWMRARGVEKAQLIIRDTNVKVRGFYESLGYGVQPRVLMARWLDGRPLTP
ncbi:MAG: GNAT family acetyltransferase [Rhodospirillales bacterium]|nr:GNAT family acetyltransferase [Rhodospirillales bacterium]